MARVVVTRAAINDLRGLTHSRQLPSDTVERVKRSLLPLEEFPELGARLAGTLSARRFLLGPWRWMIIVYRYDLERDLVSILAIVDGRMSTSPTANR